MPKSGNTVAVDGLGLPLWLVLELTYRCPLHCSWCNNPLDFDQYRNELTTEEWKTLLRQARKAGSVQLGFSGGEPLLRHDLEELVAEADQLGFYTNLITSGIGLTPQRMARLKEAGLKHVQLSMQACDSELCDTMVGLHDAYKMKIAAAREIKAQGFPMVLNVPVSRYNIDHVEDFIALAEDLGIEYIEFANLQYYNWALLNRSELLPTRHQLDVAEAKINAARERLGRKMTLFFVIPDYYSDRPKACMNGWGAIHLTIAPDGTALPCQEARLLKGIDFPNVRDGDLRWIWQDSPGFRKFRGDDWMKEPCRSCDERHKDFGGCRCQAFMLTGDAANTDPACAKSPHHHIMTDAVAAACAPDRAVEPLVMRQRADSRKPAGL
ncbi:MAG TPA: pyrroloquinoline quinone biosynthesis protein PqqE [Candidatus Sulfotelmatobacter sp.]|nr:pyrroloquinoline quinone biosynthesis protein PqqE [Candidatus Sulfotelmatobacter sp.]